MVPSKLSAIASMHCHNNGASCAHVHTDAHLQQLRDVPVQLILQKLLNGAVPQCEELRTSAVSATDLKVHTVASWWRDDCRKEYGATYDNVEIPSTYSVYGAR